MNPGIAVPAVTPVAAAVSSSGVAAVVSDIVVAAAVLVAVACVAGIAVLAYVLRRERGTQMMPWRDQPAPAALEPARMRPEITKRGGRMVPALGTARPVAPAIPARHVAVRSGDKAGNVR